MSNVDIGSHWFCLESDLGSPRIWSSHCNLFIWSHYSRLGRDTWV